MCEFEFHYWELGEFTEDKADYILKLMDDISKGFFTGNQYGKSIFHLEKQNLEPNGNSMYTTEYLAFG